MIAWVEFGFWLAGKAFGFASREAYSLGVKIGSKLHH